MPRQARLDAPGILHHVMVRGLERRPIFRDDVDQRDFCTRLEGLVEATTLTVYAWALLWQRRRRPTGGASLGGLPGCATQPHRSGTGERVLTVGETEKNIRMSPLKGAAHVDATWL